MISPYLPAIRAHVVDVFLFGEAADLPSDDASLLEQGIVDSMGVLDLIMFVEEQFRISVADEEVTPTNFKSIAALASYVQAKVGEPAHAMVA